LLAYGQLFSPGTPVSSTTKTGRPDIAEILLKVVLNHQKSKNQSIIYINLKVFLRFYVFLYIFTVQVVE
jgi:hypothetical protein